MPGWTRSSASCTENPITTIAALRPSSMLTSGVLAVRGDNGLQRRSLDRMRRTETSKRRIDALQNRVRRRRAPRGLRLRPCREARATIERGGSMTSAGCAGGVGRQPAIEHPDIRLRRRRNAPDRWP